MPSLLSTCRALGLEGEIGEREMVGADTPAGEERFRMDLLAHVRPPDWVSPTDWTMIDQDELERVLRRHAERSGADIGFGTEVVSFETDGDSVRDLGSGMGAGSTPTTSSLPTVTAAASAPSSASGSTTRDGPGSARWQDVCGVTGTGASLVRPDGSVAWRAVGLPEQPERELRRALTRLLAL